MNHYDTYKPSGIDWIGDVPSHWDYLRIKQHFYLKGRIGWQGLKADEFIDEGPYLVTGTDFDNGRVNWATCYHISEKRYNEAPEIHVKRGDLLITKDGTVGKMAYIDFKPEKVSLNSHLLIIRPYNPSVIQNKFVYWTFLTQSFYHYKGLTQTGSIMESLSQEKIGDYVIPCPPLSEQEAIAAYLDKRCGEIDKVITTQERRIELLREMKQSIITRAVTKGINPNAPMKDSGVEWIGEVPTHWEVARLKFLMQLINGRAYLQPEFQSEGKYRILRVGNFFTNDAWYYSDMELDPIKYCEKGDLLYAWSASFGPKIWDGEKVIYHYHIWKVLTNSNYDKKYAYYMLDAISENKRSDTHGSTMTHITMESMNNSYIPVPPLSEQQSIVAYIEKKMKSLDAAITKAQREVELLRELKQATITEVVTGKRKVC